MLCDCIVCHRCGEKTKMDKKRPDKGQTWTRYYMSHTSLGTDWSLLIPSTLEGLDPKYSLEVHDIWSGWVDPTKNIFVHLLFYDFSRYINIFVLRGHTLTASTSTSIPKFELSKECLFRHQQNFSIFRSFWLKSFLSEGKNYQSKCVCVKLLNRFSFVFSIPLHKIHFTIHRHWSN